MVKLWRESLAKVNQKAAESLADPTEYENLFPGLKEAFVAEQYLRETCLGKCRPATDYPLVTVREITLCPHTHHMYLLAHHTHILFKAAAKMNVFLSGHLELSSQYVVVK